MKVIYIQYNSKDRNKQKETFKMIWNNIMLCIWSYLNKHEEYVYKHTCNFLLKAEYTLFHLLS